MVAAVLIVVVTAFFLLPPPPRSGPPMVGYSHLSGLKPTQLQDGGAPRPDDIMEVWVSPTSLRTDPDSTSEKIRDLAIGTRVKVISPVKQRWIHIEVLISKGQIESLRAMPRLSKRSRYAEPSLISNLKRVSGWPFAKDH